jgi:hypothetical protein
MAIQYEPAALPRFSIHHVGGKEELLVPARRQLFAAAFMMCWLGGWAVGEVSVSQQLIAKGFHPFLFFWLCAWTLGGLAAAASLLWMLAGREVIAASPSMGLEIAYRAFGLERRKHYRPDLIRNLGRHHRISQAHAGNNLSWPWANATNSSLCFGYGGRTVYFGVGLDEEEAGLVLEHLKARLPRSAVANP